MVVKYYYFFFYPFMIGPILGNKNRRLNLNTHKARAHRWRFALADNPFKVGCLWDENLKARNIERKRDRCYECLTTIPR